MTVEDVPLFPHRPLAMLLFKTLVPRRKDDPVDIRMERLSFLGRAIDSVEPVLEVVPGGRIRGVSPGSNKRPYIYEFIIAARGVRYAADGNQRHVRLERIAGDAG